MNVTTVLFDLGGTLLTYERREQLGRAGTVALERLGLAEDDPRVRNARRRASEQVEREYAARSSFLHRELFRDRIARTAELLGVPASAEVLDRFDEEHRQAILDHLIPQVDARATLLELRARGLYTAVVSNADDDYLGALMHRHGLDTLVDHWTSSEEAGSCKPDPGIYAFALAKAGRTASEALFVGDSPQHDVGGARAAGMRTVLIGEPGTTAPLSVGLAAAPADYNVRTLLEVVAIVDGINRAGQTLDG
jgi:putative hydrolase of the HAD superfamily